MNFNESHFRDSNQYETQFSEPDDRELPGGPLDDRDKVEPEFVVEDELAFNLGVEQPTF